MVLATVDHLGLLYFSLPCRTRGSLVRTRGSVIVDVFNPDVTNQRVRELHLTVAVSPDDCRQLKSVRGVGFDTLRSTALRIMARRRDDGPFVAQVPLTGSERIKWRTPKGVPHADGAAVFAPRKLQSEISGAHASTTTRSMSSYACEDWRSSMDGKETTVGVVTSENVEQKSQDDAVIATREQVGAVSGVETGEMGGVSNVSNSMKSVVATTRMDSEMDSTIGGAGDMATAASTRQEHPLTDAANLRYGYSFSRGGILSALGDSYKTWRKSDRAEGTSSRGGSKKSESFASDVADASDPSCGSTNVTQNTADMDRKVLKSLRVTAKFRRVNISWGRPSRSLDRWATPHVVQLNEEGRVVELVLMFGAISGSIPAALGNLKVLMGLFICNNRLTGQIPPELGELVGLKELHLKANQLKGSIPPELGNLTSLRELQLQNNELTGHIPSTLGSLRILRKLVLCSNKLSGVIPPELGDLMLLLELHLQNNRLSGSIPLELGSLAALGVLDLSNNRLRGTFPPQLYDLQALRTIRVRDGNDIDGAPPDLNDRASLARWVQAYKSGAGRQRLPLASSSVEWVVAWWHFLLPVIDDITDILLLWETYETDSLALWWVCLFAVVIANADRLYVLALVIFLALLYSFLVACTFSNRVDYYGGVLEWLRVMNSGQHLDPSASSLKWLLLDGISWVVLGSRARSSDLMSSFGLAGEAPAQVAEDAGLGLRAIDVLVHHHPFRYFGELLFAYPYGHRIPRERYGGATRRAEVMVRAVGETLTVDPLFLALSIVTSGWDADFTGVVGLSALSSLLELITELQYYATSALTFLEEPGGVSPREISEPLSLSRSLQSRCISAILESGDSPLP